MLQLRLGFHITGQLDFVGLAGLLVHLCYYPDQYVLSRALMSKPVACSVYLAVTTKPKLHEMLIASV